MSRNIRVDDEYTNRARKEGYLARSVYKLQHIDEKYKLFDSETKRILDI
jgi:23S rRNA (uridine2552-2'-O)-methyltransferase